MATMSPVRQRMIEDMTIHDDPPSLAGDATILYLRGQEV